MNETKTNINVNVDNLFSEFNKQVKTNRKLTVISICSLVLLACEKRKVVSKNSEIKDLMKEIEELKGMKGD